MCVFHPLLREVWVSCQGSPGMLTRRKLVRGISPRRVKLPRIDRPKQFMGEDKPHMTMMVMMIRSRMDLLGSCMRGANTKTKSNLLNSATGCLDLVTLTNHGAAKKLGAHVHAIAKGRPCNLHSYYTSPRPREDQTALTLLNLSCANPQTEDRRTQRVERHGAAAPVTYWSR